MSSNPTSGAELSGRTAFASCGQCGARSESAAICSECGHLLPLSATADHYVVIGLQPHLAIDSADLDRRYYALSRLLHPDRHHQEPADVQQIAMQNTAALTRAYRTLRDPVARARYWLELQGDGIGTDNNKVPPALAALVFEVQEEIEACREADSGARPALLEALRARLAALDAERQSLLDGMQAFFVKADSIGEPDAALRSELKALLSNRAYLETLARDVGRALGEAESAAVAPTVAPDTQALGQGEG